MEVLEDTVGSHNQIDDGKNPETNGTVVPALTTIVNPCLGSVYDLQFKLMLEALGVLEQNSKVLKEATKLSDDQIDTAMVPKATCEIVAIPKIASFRSVSFVLHIGK